MVGEQDLLREMAVGTIQTAALREGESAFNLDTFDGELARMDDVLVACNLYPMLGGRRVVSVKRADTLLSDSDAEGLVDYLRRPAGQTVLLLELKNAPDSRRKSWKELHKRAVVVRCDRLKDRDVEAWLSEQATRLGLRLDRSALRYLVTELGSDLRRQRSELEKIALYAPGRSLDMEELGVVLGRGKAQSIFKLTDAVGERDAGRALKQLGRLMEEGEPPLAILALLDRVVGQIAVVKQMRAERKRAAEMSSVLGVPGWKAGELVRQSERFEPHELENAVQAISGCDRALKTSGVPARLLLEKLIVTLCGRPVGRGDQGLPWSARGARGNPPG